MAICNSSCAPNLPVAYSSGCGIQQRPGGIKAFTFVKCDYVFDDITDTGEWITAKNQAPNPDLVISGFVLGQKPKGTFTKKRIASCQPEAVSGAEKQITFQDYFTNVPSSCSTSSYNFWNTILSNPTGYQMGYWTCDNMFYGLVSDFQIELDEVVEDNNTGSIYFDGTITWNSIQMICPIALNLDAILLG